MGEQDTTARDWVLGFADEVLRREPELTELDQAAGDGDFGANIAGACRLVRDEIGRLGADAPARQVLGAAADVFLDEVGGTSGPLFGLLFQAISRELGDRGLTPASLADGVAEGLAAIQRVGEAQPGDKTLVDALDPAARALRGLDSGAGLGEAFRAAATAAREGAEATTDSRARRGRASYVGDHARGVPDPGAVTIGYLFAAGTPAN